MSIRYKYEFHLCAEMSFGCIFECFPVNSVWRCAVSERNDSWKSYSPGARIILVLLYFFYLSRPFYWNWSVCSVQCIVYSVPILVCVSTSVSLLFFSSPCDFVGDKWNVCCCMSNIGQTTWISGFSIHYMNETQTILFLALSLLLASLLALNHCSPYRCGFVLNK